MGGEEKQDLEIAYHGSYTMTRIEETDVVNFFLRIAGMDLDRVH